MRTEKDPINDTNRLYIIAPANLSIKDAAYFAIPSDKK